MGSSLIVSTHSRPKAAGRRGLASLSRYGFQHTAARRRLCCHDNNKTWDQSFNTQPPEGGCYTLDDEAKERGHVSTHSRPKAAAREAAKVGYLHCFNTQPPEGGWQLERLDLEIEFVSTHSRPKAAVTT